MTQAFSYLKFLRSIRTAINALMIAALLAGLIPPPALTRLARTVAPTPLAPIAEAAADAVQELVEAVTAPATALAAPNQIDGVVFRDYAADGVNDATDPGIVNIVVTAYDDGGNSASTTTNASGAYTLTATSGTPSALSGRIRIEFSLPTDGSLDFLEPTTAGPDSGTTVQFADMDGGATVNAGFYNPVDYCNSDPLVVTPCFTFGEYNSATSNTPALAGARMSWGISADGVLASGSITETQIDANGNPNRCQRKPSATVTFC